MLGPKPDERETWGFVAERRAPSDTIQPMRTAYGVRTGDEILWVRTVTDLTAPEVCEKYRRRCLLMSAAPDLLEAAKAAVARMTADCLHMCGGAPTDEICGRIACPVLADIQRLEAAIAKATGRDEK